MSHQTANQDFHRRMARIRRFHMALVRTRKAGQLVTMQVEQSVARLNWEMERDKLASTNLRLTVEAKSAPMRRDQTAGFPAVPRRDRTDLE